MVDRSTAAQWWTARRPLGPSPNQPHLLSAALNPWGYLEHPTPCNDMGCLSDQLAAGPAAPLVAIGSSLSCACHLRLSPSAACIQQAESQVGNCLRGAALLLICTADYF